MFQDRLWPVKCHVNKGADFVPPAATNRSETNSSLKIWWVKYCHNTEEAENVRVAQMIEAENATSTASAQIMQRSSNLLKKHLIFPLHKSTRKA